MSYSRSGVGYVDSEDECVFRCGLLGGNGITMLNRTSRPYCYCHTRMSGAREDSAYKTAFIEHCTNVRTGRCNVPVCTYA